MPGAGWYNAEGGYQLISGGAGGAGVPPRHTDVGLFAFILLIHGS